MTDRVDALIVEHRFDRVAKDLPAAKRFLQQASLDCQGARRELAASNPTGAYTLLWDAVRKVVTAHALAAGLKPSSVGTHASLVVYAEERLRVVATHDDIDALDRMRRSRNRSEYDGLPISNETVEHDLPAAQRLLEAVLHDLAIVVKPG